MQKILVQWIITIRKMERSRGQKNGEVMRTEEWNGEVLTRRKSGGTGVPELSGVVRSYGS